MLSSAVSPALALLLLILTVGVSAHKDWMEKLPECWQECLSDTGDGCDSSDCICDASQDDKFLPPAVACAATTCEAGYLELQGRFLLPLGGMCLFDGNPIPIDVASSAEEAARASTTATTTLGSGGYGTTQAPQPTTDGQKDDEVLTTTITKTTTDEDGQTLQIVVPVVIGPKTTSFGRTVTSTVDAESTATESPTSIADGPTSTDRPSPASSQAQQEAGSSTSSEAPEKTSSGNGNGSLFENMQATASHRAASKFLAGLGAAIALFIGA
jgi:hypothetical protein